MISSITEIICNMRFKKEKWVSSNWCLLQPKHDVSFVLCQCRRNEPVSWKEEEWVDRQTENMIGCCLRWVDLQIWYGTDRAITSNKLSDLLSLLLVPASFAWQDRACPDHNYALTYVPARPPTTKSPALHLPPLSCTTPSPLNYLIHAPLYFLYSSITYQSYLFCFQNKQNSHIRAEDKSSSKPPFSVWFVLFFFYKTHSAVKLYLILSYILQYCLHF